jgi:16S rRNA (cytidine1402-2'-O)-methyltransferase
MPADRGGLAGELVIVGTPIGNLGDLGSRARAVLGDADVICAEDTRRTRKLLSAFDLHPRRLVSVRARNEERESARVLRWLAEGRRVALVTDAGMPGLSDPGGRLARAVIAGGGRLTVAPGPDAAPSALLVSGLPRERWSFEGFLPLKGPARALRVAAVAAERRTVVLFEAPHRLLRTLADLEGAAGTDRVVVVANDLTKRFERVWRGTVGEVAARLGAAALRGEFVIVVAPAPG